MIKIKSIFKRNKWISSNVKIIPTNNSFPKEWIEIYGNSEKEILETLKNSPILMQKFERATDSILEIKTLKQKITNHIKYNPNSIKENDKELSLMKNQLLNLLIKYQFLVSNQENKKPLEIFGRFAQLVSSSIPRKN